MSLLINGLDMPKCCCDCSLYDSAGFCALDPTRGFEDYNHKRPDDCTLVEIPTPHGDLIDRDDLLAYFERKSKGKTAEEALKLLYTALKAYPTVIEKENTQ